VCACVCVCVAASYRGDGVVLQRRVVLQLRAQRLPAGEREQRRLGGDLTDALVPLLWPQACSGERRG